jgi:FtsP/CotA-like multicopper oxidase with cupredoxin domain
MQGKELPLAANELRIPPVISGGNLTIAPSTYKIFPGVDANILSINNSFPAPTIKLQKGDTFTAKIINNLSETTVLHWHGIHSPAFMDGHPKNSISPGGTFDVSIPIIQRAGTFFYHSHADMNTARQTYMGMAGLFLIEDEEEKALGLPSGDYDIPLMIQDKRFDANKQLLYAPTDADMMSGWLGDTVLINGTPNPFLSVAPTLYRFRLVNASNARMYKVALSDNKQFTIIGNDGGLLPTAPFQTTSVMLSPAERLDILIDFSSYSHSENVTLKSLQFSYSGSPGTSSLAQGAEIDLLQFQVTKSGTSGSAIPSKLPNILSYNAADIKRTRIFELNGQHSINSKSFDINRIDEQVSFGDLEQWSFINESEETHPMHVHGLQFQVHDRGIDVQPENYEAGWKDVVRVEPFQMVNVLLRFADYTGLYLVHCHNLEHEDMGMMANVEVDTSGAVKGEMNNANILEITPNPATDHATVIFSPLEKDEMLIITDERGMIVFKKNIVTGYDTFRVNLISFASGSYLIKLGNLVAILKKL